MDWQDAENGWVATHPDEHTITLARRTREARDAFHGNLFEQAEGNDRWCGDLAELCFEDWLRSVGLEAQHNGGVDSLPDFHVAGLGVGMKCRTATTVFRPHFVVNVPDDHMRRRVGEAIFFFAAYEERPNRLLLLGCVSADKFRAKAVRTAGGAQMHSGLPATAGACWSVEARELAAPAIFLSYVQSRIAA